MSTVEGILGFMPKSVRLMAIGAIAALAAGAAAESRYMKISDFTKSYILDLRSDIRAIKKDIEATQDDAARKVLEEQLERMLDDLCLETRGDDPYCENRA